MNRLLSERLKTFKEEGCSIDIFLINGIRLTGSVIDFDDQALVLSSADVNDGNLVMAAAIATVMRRPSYASQPPRRNREYGNRE